MNHGSTTLPTFLKNTSKRKGADGDDVGGKMYSVLGIYLLLQPGQFLVLFVLLPRDP